jgi:hypothetical protein
MGFAQSTASVALGVVIAWSILSFFKPPMKSYYKLSPWPLEQDNSNLALVGVGLASPMPGPSVMDAAPTQQPQVAIMEQSQAPLLTNETQKILAPEYVHVATPVAVPIPVPTPAPAMVPLYQPTPAPSVALSPASVSSMTLSPTPITITPASPSPSA